MTENRRQRDRNQRAVVKALRSGDTERALLRLRRTGHLTVLDNAEDLRNRMADDWHLEHRDDKSAVMLALHRPAPKRRRRPQPPGPSQAAG